MGNNFLDQKLNTIRENTSEGRYSENYALIQEVLKLEPKCRVAWVHLGYYYESSEDRSFRKSFNAFYNGLKLSTVPREIAIGYSQIGSCLENILCYHEANEFYTKAIGIMEENKTEDVYYALYHNYANMLESMGKYNEAIVMYDKAIDNISQNKDLPLAYESKIRAFIHLKRYQDALNLCIKAKEKTKDQFTSIRFDIERAKILFSLGDVRNSEKEVIIIKEDNKLKFINYLQLNEKDSQSLAELYLLDGRIKLDDDKVLEALASFEEANKIIPASLKCSIWLIYAKYLQALFVPKNESNNVEFLCDIKKMSIIASELEKTIKMYIDIYHDKDIAKLYHWLGIIFFKLEDHYNAMKYLIYAGNYYKKNNLKLSPFIYFLRMWFKNSNSTLRIYKKRRQEYNNGIIEVKYFLNHLWNKKMSPSWLDWWFKSPKYTGSIIKKLCGGILISLIFCEIVILMLTQFNIFPKMDMTLYGITFGAMILILLAPLMNRFKVANIEVDITQTSQVISPALIDIDFEPNKKITY